ncbi:MAG: PHP domain-containing protein, partial [Novosphingobium sp.]|nr:PHP domain-containing protein [Novosphingobium sp.]
MPEAPLTPPRRHGGGAHLQPPRPAPFVELGLVSCFSFLRGASDAVDLAARARALGYDALGIADANSLAGVVRLHSEARALGLRPVIGCRIETAEGLEFLAYPADRAAYGRLSRLISAGRMATLEGAWQDKGVCDISLAMLAGHSEGVHLVLVPPRDLEAQFTIAGTGNVVALDGSRREQALQAPLSGLLPHLAARLPTLRHLAASYLYSGDDLARINALDALARQHGLAILATNLPLYHAPQRRPLHDVMTAIRHK